MAPRSKAELQRLKVTDLRKICDDLDVCSQGNKTDLIKRIIEQQGDEETVALPTNEDANQNSVNQITQLMLQLIEQQQEDRRERDKDRQERDKDRQLMLRFLQGQADRSEGLITRSNSASSLNSVVEDAKLTIDKAEWLFEKIERKLSNLELEINHSLGSFTYKESIKSLESNEEKLCNLLEGGKSCLSEHQAQSLKSRFETISRQVQEMKINALKLCKQEEEEKHASCLPSGIHPPEFHGDANQFPIWWESFDAVVNSNDKISVFYKYRYLRQCLKGQASHCLDGFSPLSESYQAALEHVKSRFGQPRKVVRHIMKSIIDMPILTSNDARSLRKTFDLIQGKLHSLCNYSDKIENPVDAIVIPILESKLTNDLKRSWEKELLKTCEDNEFATIEKYSQWLCREVKSRETVDVHETKRIKERTTNVVPFSAQALPMNINENARRYKPDRSCKKCLRTNHALRDCYKFLKDSVKERWRFAKEKNLCFQCLDDFHPGKSCTVNEPCAVDACTRRHHSLLHFAPARETEAETVQSLFSGINVSCSSPRKNADKIMPSAIATIHAGNGKSKTVRIAFDTMCQDSFIREKTVLELGMNYEKNLQMDVSGFGEKISSMKTGRVSFGLSKFNESVNIFHVDALVRPGKICAPLEPLDIDWSRCSHLKYLDIADELPHLESEIDVLIGLNHYLKLVTGSLVRHPSDDCVPAAMETVFGYVLMGMNQQPQCRYLKPESNCKEKIECMFIQVRDKTDLELTVEKFWNLESIGILDSKRMLTQDERDAVDQFEKSIKFKDDRYSVKLPFRKDAPKLESNFDSAKRQMLSTERRLKENGKLKQNYEKAMQDYEQLGFARKASGEEIAEFSKGPEYFIPHHAVIREESVSTKTRVVFNASSPDKNGNSLNDCLLPGPALQPDLNQILLRFRVRKIALMADIAKMFCQTQIDSSDYRYQQYLWRHFNEDSEPTRYIMTRLMFGLKPSPFLAIGSVNHHLQRSYMQEKYPLGCVASSDIYVDDYCGGADTVDETIELARQLREVFSEGGWKMTKFVSNSSSVMNTIPEEDRLPTQIVDFEDHEFGFAKALGIGWNVSEDSLIIRLSDSLRKPLDKVTKRSVLSKVCQVYDVFGFYTAFTIKAKIMIQSFWDLKISWDENLPEDLVVDFRQWENELLQLNTIKVPRLMIEGIPGTVELISFSDASEKAYGCIIYLRVIDQDRNIKVHFVMAKARVSPRKSKTLARLELIAVLLAARLTKYVIDGLYNLNFDKIRFFTDSTIALSWIRKSSAMWKPFVANRVQEIHDLFDTNMFYHVISSENPADSLSRGISVATLKDSELFWKGPPWLSLPTNEWPEGPQDVHADESQEYQGEAKTGQTLVIETTEHILLSRYESFMKIVRVLAQILKWKKVVPRTKDGNLTSNDCKIAEHFLIRSIQKVYLCDEFEALTNTGFVSCKSSILSLDPVFNRETNLITVGGRLNFSDLPEESKHQIIIPSQSLLSEKLILHYHVQYDHAPIETTLSILREKYWIIHGRREVRKAIHKCLKCRHSSTVSLEQKMAPLPSKRVCPAPAFTNIGVDFTGFLLIKNGNEIVKAYICIFTCMQSRMVHFELTLSMETEDFLNALRRMMNRRGMCRFITSDNFSSFKKAAKVVKAQKVYDFCAERGIEWQFITERSPFRGGFYERLNLSLKKPLKIVLGKAMLTYCEMYTVITDIECAINQRPLTYLGSDPKDLKPITPAQLALGRSLTSLPDVVIKDTSIHSRYKHLQQLQDHFWKRWSKEYLPQLQVRRKWKREMPTLHVNDICLIPNEKTARNKWPLARVTELIPGRDGVIRTVRLQNTNGICIRPVQRLHLFEKFEG